MNTTFFVQINIESLEEIIDEVPSGTTQIICIGKDLRSLKGIDRLPSVTKLNVSHNQITSLEGLAGSNVIELTIFGNQITSLEGLAGSNVLELNISNNRITSFEGLAGSNVSILHISNNQIASLEGLAESNVLKLYIYNNPCSQQIRDEFKESVEKVKEYYSKKNTSINKKMEEKITLIEKIESQYNKIRNTKEFLFVSREFGGVYSIKIGTFTFQGDDCVKMMEELYETLTR